MQSSSKYLPLLFIFPAVFFLTSGQAALVLASSNQQQDDNDNSATLLGQANQGVAIGEQNPTGDTGGGGTTTTCDEDEEFCGTPPQPGPPGPGPQVGQQNLAESNQVGGIGAGNINQRAQGAVNEQLCSTVGGIGNRQCQQTATPGAQNLQDCSAIAGLGKANCVQSENPSGPDNCLTANGKPFICETSTGRSLSGSGQAGQ